MSSFLDSTLRDWKVTLLATALRRALGRQRAVLTLEGLTEVLTEEPTEQEVNHANRGLSVQELLGASRCRQV
jgi:hypothetical protein